MGALSKLLRNHKRERQTITGMPLDTPPSDLQLPMLQVLEAIARDLDSLLEAAERGEVHIMHQRARR